MKYLKALFCIVAAFLMSVTAHAQYAGSLEIRSEDVAPDLSQVIDDIGAEEGFDPRVEQINDQAYADVDAWSGRDCVGAQCQRAQEEQITDPAIRTHAASNAVAIIENFKDYSNHPKVVGLIAEARENLRRKSYIERRVNPVTKAVSFMTFCYRAVKEALQGSGMVRHYLPSGEARFAVEDLKRAGFKNLLDLPDYAVVLTNAPRMAPKGTVLVYTNNPTYVACARCPRPSSAGHTEIKTQDAGREGYISVSETFRPTYGYRLPQHRLLIGVMYKTRL